jgi:hypothetical protein
MRVRLIKKFAEMIDGIDLSGRSVGDVLNVNPSEGKLLIAEQWAVGGDEPSPSRPGFSGCGKRESTGRSSASDSRRRR